MEKKKYVPNHQLAHQWIMFDSYPLVNVSIAIENGHRHI
jgi:hypothetical protein